MATPAAQDDAARLRIIKHMNADHQDSIRRYIEAYSNKSLFQTRDAHLSDINLNDMKITCNGRQHAIAFDPPMKSLREARERVVQLDKDALRILDRSDIVVDKYIPPTVHIGHLWNFSQCFFAYILLPFSSNWQPGSLMYSMVLYKFPTFSSYIAQFGWWIVFAFMIPIHTIEAAIMARRLRNKHGLTPLDWVWWSWTASCFVEGITAKWRLNNLVEIKRKEKEAKKH
ncbi:hypothetical protein GQ44DRAFT_449017 [Phaeosphaeriaceae sp. PMI808]|nr:hypothetical protein GQ44DRAFT_449017 [Phaeosphaeriaceae sp. PMI808]